MAQRQNVKVCAVDQPTFSDFTTPAIVDRDPVVVAIGTEGTAPVLSRQIKATIEEQLETHLGAIAKKAAKLRPWVAENIAKGLARREFWARFFERERSGRSSDAAANLKGKVAFVGTGPGDRELLTMRARKILDKADVIISPKTVDRRILELARREALLIQDENTDLKEIATERARRGELVAWLRGTAPAITNGLGHLITEFQTAGISCEDVPGVTAAPLTSLLLQSEHTAKAA